MKQTFRKMRNLNLWKKITKKVLSHTFCLLSRLTTVFSCLGWFTCITHFLRSKETLCSLKLISHPELYWQLETSLCFMLSTLWHCRYLLVHLRVFYLYLLLFLEPFTKLSITQSLKMILSKMKRIKWNTNFALIGLKNQSSLFLKVRLNTWTMLLWKSFTTIFKNSINLNIYLKMNLRDGLFFLKQRDGYDWTKIQKNKTLNFKFSHFYRKNFYKNINRRTFPA